MRCQACGLHDPYRGNGDGIGSCDCIRCDCCGAGPYDCDCRMDLEEDLDETDGFDPLCNDTACMWRELRMKASDPA